MILLYCVPSIVSRTASFFCEHRVLFWRAWQEVALCGSVTDCHSERLECGFPERRSLNARRAKLRRFRYLSAPLSVCTGSYRLCGELEPWLAALCGRSACCWHCCCRWKVRLCPAHLRRSTCSAFCAALWLWGRITGRPAWQRQTLLWTESTDLFITYPLRILMLSQPFTSDLHVWLLIFGAWFSNDASLCSWSIYY